MKKIDKRSYLVSFGLIITLVIGGINVPLVELSSGAQQPTTYVNITLIESNKDVTKINYKIGEFTREEVEINGEEYYRIFLSSESNIMEKGSPDLPNICRSIIIPDDAKMDVHIIDADYQKYEEMLIAPSKGIIPRTINPSDVPYEFGDVYEKNDWYPGKIAELDDPYILRDFRGQVVQVNPFQYNPLTKKLRVYTDITIEIYPAGDGEVNVYHRDEPLTSIDSDFKLIYENHFINYNSAMGRYTPVGEQGNMLVITYDSFWSSMLPFVEWKNMKGIPTEMVNVSDIGGGTATDIDGYIENYYNTHGLTFVLLVGDIDQIPSLYYGSHASDPSYSYIVGSDNYQDLFVGRFSAQTISQLETQVERTIEYEKYPQAGAEWYHKGIGIGSDEGTGDDGEYDWEHIRNIRADLLNFTYTWVDEFYGGSQGGNDAPGSPSPSDIGNALNDGRSIVNFCGHGAWDGWGWGSAPGWYVFDISDVDNLVNDNMLPYVVCVACDNGMFYNHDTCYAEAWMRATNSGSGEPTGAIAVFASTLSQSWSPPMDAQDEIVDLLVNGSYNTIGGLSFSGTMHMMDEYGSGCYDETNCWTVFGDPSLQIRTDIPSNMTVNHNDVLISGSSSFDVTVTGIEGALCAISYNGVLLGYNYTDVNGQATIQFDEPITEPEVVDFVVTAYNKIPYITTIEVAPPVRQPAQFEPMEGILIRYSFGISYDIIAEMAEDVEVVTIVANAGEQSTVISEYTSHGVDLSNCSFLVAPSDSYWTRDYGPWFIYNDTAREMEVVDFEYNRPRPNDNAIPLAYATDQGFDYTYMDIKHTGGNYMTDGQGIAVSTDLVWDENPGLIPDDIDQIVADNLGIRTYHVYPDPLGEYIEHVDCWAKYLSPDTIMIIEVSPSHSHYADIEAAADYFESQLNCYGTPYNIVRVYTHLQEPYINSLILNNKVFVPITGSTWDDDAIASYETAMPGYGVLGFTALPGHPWQNTDGLHCRAKGIPDRGMLYIEHKPLTDQMPSDDGFLVEAEFTLFSGGSLVNGSPVVYWKTETGGWNTVQMNFTRDNLHCAYIPSQPCGENISYYIHAEDTSGRIENHPYIGAPDPHSFTVTLVPDIWVDPLSFEFMHGEGFTLSDNLTIGNDEYAGEELTFNISCTDDAGFGWLSVNITQESLLPNASMAISVMVDTTGLNVGDYYESIIVTSNDPDEPMLTISVNLSVVFADDVGAVSVNSPTGSQPPRLYTINATIENFGFVNQTNVLVNCTIYEGGIGGVILEEDFSGVTPPAIPTGWTATHTNWATYASSNAGGVSPEARFYWSPSSTDVFRLYTGAMDTSGYTSLNLMFKHFVNHYTGSYTLRVETSTDGSTWNPVWTLNPTGDVGPETINISLDASDGVGSSTFYVSFTFDGYSWNINYWHIDDINISGEVVGNVSYSAETTINVSAYSIEYVEFSPPWDATINFYGIQVTTMLPGDQDPSNDQIVRSVEIKPPTIDYITITETEGGAEIADQTISLGWNKTGYASAYNNTCGYIGLVSVNWSVVNVDGANATTFPLTGNWSTFNAEESIGNATWKADDGNGHNDTVIFEITGISVDIPLYSGWNLITIPVENDYTAKSLIENISGCQIVCCWDSIDQEYECFTIHSPSGYDFPIENGMGYFIGVTEDSNFSVTGKPISNVSINLYEGWNLIGWFKENSTTAMSLLENITSCEIVCRWDSIAQEYDCFTSGSPPEYSFPIEIGMGIFVGVTEESVWCGEG